MVTVGNVESSYPNIIFQKRTKQDQLNKSLLDDIQKAAAANNQKVTVDFAKSGHRRLAKSGNVSRHWVGSAVDIDFIYEDGEKYVVSPKNRAIVEKFTDTLQRMGYNKNAEGKSNPKAFLTFGFEGHSDHVHVSNLSDQSSEISGPAGPSEPTTDDSDMNSTTSTTDSGYGSKTSLTPTTQTSQTSKNSTPEDMVLYQAAKNLGKELLGLQESFGKNIKKNMGVISIPGDSNPKIKSPIDGKINNTKFVSGCRNQIIIESDESPTYFLQYCGVSRPKVKNGQKVSEGQVIALMEKEDNSEVYLLDSSYQRKHLEPTKITNKLGKEKDTERKPNERTYPDAAIAGLILAPKKIFGNVYDKDTGEIKVRKWSTDQSKRPVDPWIINAIKKPFQKKKKEEQEEKLQENIKRIKDLL